jgi:hypothetical protein
MSAFEGKAENIGSMRVFRILTDTVDKVDQETGGTLIFAFAGRWLAAPFGEAMTFLSRAPV